MHRLLIFVHNLPISYFCSSVYLCVRALLLEAPHQSHLVRFLYSQPRPDSIHTHTSVVLSSYVLQYARDIHLYTHIFPIHSRWYVSPLKPTPSLLADNRHTEKWIEIYYSMCISVLKWCERCLLWRFFLLIFFFPDGHRRKGERKRKYTFEVGRP